MIGVRVAHRVAEAAHDVAALGLLVRREPERGERPRRVSPRGAGANRADGVGAVQVREQPRRVPPSHRDARHNSENASDGPRSRASPAAYTAASICGSGWQRSSNDQRRRAGVVVAIEAVAAARQALRVGLEPVPQPRLRDAAAALEVVDQQVEVVAQLGVEPRHERADDCRPAGAARPADRSAGTARRARRAASGPRPRVTHLEFRREHTATLPVIGLHVVDEDLAQRARSAPMRRRIAFGVEGGDDRVGRALAPAPTRAGRSRTARGSLRRRRPRHRTRRRSASSAGCCISLSAATYRLLIAL